MLSIGPQGGPDLGPRRDWTWVPEGPKQGEKDTAMAKLTLNTFFSDLLSRYSVQNQSLIKHKFKITRLRLESRILFQDISNRNKPDIN